MKHASLLALGLVTLGACAMSDGTMQATGRTPAATATETLRDASGRAVGTATVAQVGDSLRVTIAGAGLPQGAHGAHIHTTGLCQAPAFETAGPHWNPTGRQHGKDNPAGMHKGDLPNLTIDQSGRGSIEYVVEGASLTGAGARLLDADGAAVVVHATDDDYRTDPSGNSGGRIACAAFR